jgi:hypothetical protein
MFKNDIDNYPEHYNVYNNYAQYLIATGGQLDNAKLNYIGYHLFTAEKLSKHEWELQMNLAAFFATIGQWEEALKRTVLAEQILYPLGGSDTPRINLEKQRLNMEAIVADIKSKQGAATNSPPDTESRNSYGKRTEESVLESVGAIVA